MKLVIEIEATKADVAAIAATLRRVTWYGALLVRIEAALDACVISDRHDPTPRFIVRSATIEE